MKNERLILREIIEADYPDLIDISFYDGVAAQSVQDAKIMNEKIIQDAKDGNSYHWIICHQSSGEIYGTCGFYRGFLEQTGEIGYVLKANAQGKGIMGEAVGLMLEFGWKQLKLKSIVAFTDKDNQASIKLLKKQNFIQEQSEGEEFKFLIQNPDACAY
jgi:ribosomal-protein-alanine N-acetyltransferase